MARENKHRVGRFGQLDPLKGRPSACQLRAGARPEGLLRLFIIRVPGLGLFLLLF